MISDTLDQDIPEPSVSKLYPLEPIGIGTNNVECLTSYVSRLAEAHCVKTSMLMKHEILPCTSDQREPTNEIRTHRMVAATLGSLNHYGSPAQKVVAALQKMTWKDDLRYTTLIPWRDSIGALNLSRQHRAWCPECFKELAGREVPLYDKLLWTLNVVKVCPEHGSPLIDLCPTCNRRVPFFSEIDKCPKCSTNLYMDAPIPSFVPDDTQIKLSHQIGQLLGFVTPSLSSLPSRNSICKSLNRCVALYFDCSSTLFSTSLGLSISYGNNLLHDYNPPSLSTLIKLSFFTQISILDLITDNYDQDISVPPRKQYGSEFWSKKANDILRYMSPKSTSEIIGKLKTSRTTFNKNLPELRVKYNAFTQKKAAGLSRYGAPVIVKHQKLISPELARIRIGLRSAIDRGTGESFPMIARQLNCRTYNIKWHFPLEYKQLLEQYRNAKLEKKEQILNHLQSVLKSDTPTPTLRDIAVELNVNVNILRYHSDEMCKQIVQKREAESVAREETSAYIVEAAPTNEAVKCVLESALLEYPPPSFSEVQRRIGLRDSTIRNTFPNDAKEISTRYTDYLVAQRKLKCDQIRQTTIDLHQQGVYPSSALLAKELGFEINTEERKQAWLRTLQDLNYSPLLHDSEA